MNQNIKIKFCDPEIVSSLELLHYGATTYNPSLSEPIKNDFYVKPAGGLWTVPLTANFDLDDFHETLNTTMGRSYPKSQYFKLKLKKGALVAEIDSIYDLLNLPYYTFNHLGSKRYIDFEMLHQKYNIDAIWLTNKGLIETHDSSLLMNLNGWDSESVLVMNPESVYQVPNQNDEDNTPSEPTEPEIMNHFVFDVESTSLYGTGFAVGAVVVDQEGNEIDRFELLSKEGAEKANSWVKRNVIPNIHDMPTCENDEVLRFKFYKFYMKHKDTDTCEFWSDCNYPVETNFLNAIVSDDVESKQWDMPYPLKDISTLIDINIDRAEACGIQGLRKHHPLDDARASAALLIKHLNN
jgi:hypothetical protein